MAILLIVMMFSPSINSQSILPHTGIPLLYHRESETKGENRDKIVLKTIEMNVYHINSDRTFKKTVKKLTEHEKEEIMNKLNQTMQSNIPVREKFEEALHILKEYKLIPNDIELEDIFDVEKLPETYRTVEGENFIARFAPILIVGGGFGLGLGQEVRFVNAFLHFLAVVGGLGYVLAFDTINGTLYSLTSFLLPFLIGYLAAYTGILIFAVYPGYFYSNIAAIGITPFTLWVQFPPENSTLYNRNWF